MIIEEHKSAIDWWEPKRLLFNTIVLVSGVIGVIIGSVNYSDAIIFDLKELFLWFILTNMIFSLGFLAESLDYYYFNSKLKLVKYRYVLLVIEIIFFSGYTLFHAWFHYAKPPFW